MPLSADGELAVRRWVGSEDLVSTAELNSLFDQLGGHDVTVLHVLRQRQVELVSQPSSLSVPGLSITNSTNIAELRELIKAFEAEGGTGLDEDSAIAAPFSIGRLTRPGRR
jgi:hypothetical protein